MDAIIYSLLFTHTSLVALHDLISGIKASDSEEA